MLRLILAILLFLLSLLVLIPAPTACIWYVTLMVTEFPWIFLCLVSGLIVWSLFAARYRIPVIGLCAASFALFLWPVAVAYKVGRGLDQRLESAFGPGISSLPRLHQQTPFAFWRMITGIGAPEIPYTTYHYSYAANTDLTLDFYKAQQPGRRPCVVVVHGGSWRAGTSQQLPDMNWYLARQGYNVASISYRLAPAHQSPAPVCDVAAALRYLKNRANELHIDTGNFVLLGRSAGGQIVLQAAYTMHDSSIKGVIDIYGPADMVWAYHHPDNPLVMDARKVIEDFLGGTDIQVPQQYFSASAINFVTPHTVPTLLVHGGNDAHVAYEQSKMLNKKLQENRVDHLLLGLPWASHGCDYSLNGPSGQLVKYAVERFVYRVTKNDHPLHGP